MTPSDLIQWAIALAVGLIILSVTGIQDWLGKFLTQRPTRGDLQQTISDLERRLAALEREVTESKRSREPTHIS